MKPYGGATGAGPAGFGLRAAAPTSGPALGAACVEGVRLPGCGACRPALEPLEGSAGGTQVGLVSDVTGITSLSARVQRPLHGSGPESTAL